MICDYLHDAGKRKVPRKHLLYFIRTQTLTGQVLNQASSHGMEGHKNHSFDTLITIFFGDEFDSLMSSICLVGCPLLAGWDEVVVFVDRRHPFTTHHSVLSRVIRPEIENEFDGST